MEAGTARQGGRKPAEGQQGGDETAVVEGQAPGILAGLGQTSTRGVTAGLFAGLFFLLAQMGWAVERLGKPAVAPLLDMSTVFNNTDMPVVAPENIVIGLVTHLCLSMVFGLVFALFFVPLLKNTGMLLAGGLAFGVILYVVNIQILGRVIFEWFTNPMGPPQVFELFVHAFFGLLLVPFFIGAAQRVRAPAA